MRLALALLAGLVLLAGAACELSRPAAPGAFYEPAGPVPAEPGRLLASAPFTRDVPEGARGWKILYATTRPDGTPAAASALVVVPAAPAAAPRDVVAFAHGSTGVRPGCAPSTLAEPFRDVPAFPRLLEEGWAYVAPDYVGLGTAGPHLYLVGEAAARATLDALRAARALDAAELSDRAVVWGHSQGGHAALWAGQRAADALAGIAAIAPVTDLPAMAARGQESLAGKLVAAYIVTGYAAAYPDAEPWRHVRPWARPLVRDIAARCLRLPGVAVSALEAQLLPGGIYRRPPTEGAFGDRLRQNVPQGPVAAPLLIAQGGRDAAVPAEMQRAWAADRCAAGQALDYRLYPEQDHLSLIAEASPLTGELIAWTADRFAGAPAARECPG